MGISLAVSAAISFNLVCSGSIFTVAGNAPATKKEVVHEFRVDLNKMRYCAGNCEYTNQIARVSPFEIVFVDQKTPYTWHSKINRETGYLSIEGQQGEVGTALYAQCEPHPFSGFPTPRF